MKANYLNPKVELGDFDSSSDVKVFKATADGKPGRFLRTDPATSYEEELKRVRPQFYGNYKA